MGIHVLHTEGDGYFASVNGKRGLNEDIAFGGELNQTLLFGVQKIHPGTITADFVSCPNILSDENGEFQNESKTLVHSFKKSKPMDINHGLTFVFDPIGGTHPKQMSIDVYAQNKPDFTNVFPERSYSGSSNDIFNGTGYMLNTYLLNGIETYAEGYILTGRIPFFTNDTIRINGIDFMDGEYTFIYFFDVVKKWMRTYSVSELTDVFNAEIDEYGTLRITYRFLPGEGEVSARTPYYIAFSAKKPEYISDISITMNEEITYNNGSTFDKDNSFPTIYMYNSVNSCIYYASNIKEERVRKIEISVTGLNAPYTRYKLSSIYNGTIDYMGENLIFDCDITEEIDPISGSLPSCIADITTLKHPDFDFEQNTMQRYEIYFYGSLRGVFYLQSVENQGEQYKLKLSDIFEELDKCTYYGNAFLDNENGVNVKEAIKDIFTSSGIPDEYTGGVNSFLEDKISGVFPICSCRDAIRDIAFAKEYTLTCARETHISIKHLGFNEVSEISKLGEDESFEEYNLISKVSVTAPIYSSGGLKRYSSDDYGKGKKEILVIYDKPGEINPVSAASIVENTANSAIVDGTAVFTYQDPNGNQYHSNDWHLDVFEYISKYTQAYASTGNDGGITEEIEGSCVTWAKDVEAIAEHCAKWLSQNKNLKCTLIGDYAPGDTVKVNLSDNENFTGTITYCRYKPIGTTMIQEVEIRGAYNEPNV